MDDDEVRRFRGQIKLLQRRLRQEVLPLHGVSRTAMQVLSAAERLPEGAGPRAVGAELGMTSSNVAAALRELEEAGYVTRGKDPDDARRVRVLLTARGRAVVAGVRSERDSWLGRAMRSALTGDEVRLLLDAGDLLERLARTGEPPADGAGGTRP